MKNDLKVCPRGAVGHLRGFNAQLPDLPVPELKRVLGMEDVIKLSFNESPYGPSTGPPPARSTSTMTPTAKNCASGWRKFTPCNPRCCS
jgi:hypothetical protein